MEISVSILSTEDKIESVNKLNNTDANYLHLDIMDNTFVDNSAFSIDEIKEINMHSKKKIDAHLMVNNPLLYLDVIKSEKLEFFTFHVELDNVDEIINTLKDNNIKIGLAINPDTNINKLKPYLDKIDMILLMSVFPGRGGQKFIDNTYNRILEVKNIIGNRKIKISVDGGVNIDNIGLLNTNIAVIGSYITNSDDYNQKINSMVMTIVKK